MKLFRSSRAPSRPWPMKKPQSKLTSLVPLPLLTLLFLLLFFFVFYLYLSPFSFFPISFQSLVSHSNFLQCSSPSLAPGEKFLFYAPHSGFSNQLSEFKNAILMAGILNRTLVVPPVLDHHAVVLGSCPKFRVSDPNEIRFSVWEHAIQLIRTGRYISMADIVDISSLLSSSLRAIDFRAFVALLCGVNMDFTCSNEYSEQSALSSSLKQCGSLLAGLEGNKDKCLYAVSEDCRSTVWTYQNGEEDGKLDSFQPNEQIKKKKKKGSYIRRRRDVYKVFGPGSEAELATLLAFGSLFTAPYKGSELYIDIPETPRDQRVQSLIKKTEFLPFVHEIISVGKEYADKIIGSSFLCAQLRLLDGQFKNHKEATFMGMKQKIESLGEKGLQLIHVFVMTDLPESNWTGTYLGNLARDSKHFRLFFLKDDDELVLQTAKKLVTADHGLRSRSILKDTDKTNKCATQNSSDIRLFIEETVCSCASLGFVGTTGSTIAESIELMRKHKVCSN